MAVARLNSSWALALLNFLPAWLHDIFAILLSCLLLLPKAVNTPLLFFQTSSQTTLFNQASFLACQLVFWHMGVGSLVPYDFFLEECPAFLDSLAPQNCLPRDYLNHLLKRPKSATPGVWGSISAGHSTYFSKKVKLIHWLSPANWLKVSSFALPKMASSCHITPESFSVHEQQVQQGTFPSWVPCMLCQDIMSFHTLQEPPGQFSFCCVIFPGDVW